MNRFKKKHTSTLVGLFILSLFGGLTQAIAQEGENPRNSPYGAIHLKVNTAYASCTINGDPCDTEYLSDGNTIVLRKLDRKVSHKIVIQATMDNMHDGKVTVSARDFKLKRIRKGLRAWQAHKRLKLKKRRGPAPEAAPKEDNAKPEGDEEEID
jgi:hypothetical protein